VYLEEAGCVEESSGLAGEALSMPLNIYRRTAIRCSARSVQNVVQVFKP